MQPSITFTGDWAFHGIMSDLGVDYSMSPFHRIGFDIDEAGINALATQFQERVFRARKWFDDGKLNWATLLLRFDQSTFVVAHGDGHNYAEVIAADADRLNELHTEIRKVLAGGKETQQQPGFHMLRYDGCEFSAHPVENLPEPVTDDFLKLCYGDDILNWMTCFGESTLARAGGLSIFDGPPGTGKTSLIAQMIRRTESTHVFYALPASQDNALSSPEFVPFWQKQNVRHRDRVKVIVLEDAERLLWRRQGDNREAVSTLLNIADGLIGRMLRLHVVCSVNARMEDLDPAILRPGRLMHHRRFKPLNRETARRIAAARNLSFSPDEFSTSFTLAEVLNPGSYKPAQSKPSIGFQVLSSN
jgi:hypothetical protein